MNLVAQLRREEGSVPHAYQDHLGYWTIGVGRLIDARKGGGLSPDEVDYLLANDVAQTRVETLRALPWLVTLDEPRQAVLISMVFQMGLIGLLRFSQALAAARGRRWTDAASLMLQSKWAAQTPERALRMAKQMETGQWH